MIKHMMITYFIYRIASMRLPIVISVEIHRNEYLFRLHYNVNNYLNNVSFLRFYMSNTFIVHYLLESN